MDNKLEKFPCLVLKFDWNWMDQINLQPNKPFILSTKVFHQKNELFRIGLKKPYSDQQGGYGSNSSFSHATLYLLTANLKKMGLKILTVSFTYKDYTRKDVDEKEMDLKTSDTDKKENENDIIQLFTAQFKESDNFFKHIQSQISDAAYYKHQDRTAAATNTTITFTVYLIGISENYRSYQIDGLLSQQLQSFVVNQVGTDFKLITKDKKAVNVHKFILAARSSVFATIFKEPGNTFDVMDCKMDELKQFVKFIYTGELEGLVNDGLMKLATKYKVTTLENLCKVASQDVSVNMMASLALHLDPGSIDGSHRDISRELCSVENT